MLRHSNVWLWAALAWVCIILFSSTSLALRLAEELFDVLSRLFFGGMQQNSSSYGIIHLLADKGFHVALFCVLALLLWQALQDAAKKPWMIIVCGAVVGSSSEFLQRFFPDRDPAIRDVLINVGGTALGILLCLGLAKLQEQRRTPVTF